MAHTYIRFDFGKDEEKAQLARHRLDGWRQAFRLDKRVQYKMDRPGGTAAGAASKAETPEKADASAKTNASEKTKAKPAGKSPAKPAESATKTSTSADGKVGLLVRLYFSSHEKLSEQRWIERIPSEEPFKGASPQVIHHGDPEFEATDQQFESLT